MFGDWILLDPNADADSAFVMEAEGANPLDEDAFAIEPEGAPPEPQADPLQEEEVETESEAGGSDNDAPDYPPIENPWEINLNRSVFIPGPHHIIQNLTESLILVMVFWSRMVQLIKHVSRCLTYPFSKTRLLATCFMTGAQAIFYSDISGFHALIHDKRWGTMMAVVSMLLPLRVALGMGWHFQNYTGGGNAHRDEGEASIDPVIVDEAITSKLCWGYLVMLDVISWLFLGLSEWFDDCPCHSRGFDPSRRDRQARAKYYRQYEKQTRTSNNKHEQNKQKQNITSNKQKQTRTIKHKQHFNVINKHERQTNQKQTNTNVKQQSHIEHKRKATEYRSMPDDVQTGSRDGRRCSVRDAKEVLGGVLWEVVV